MGALPQLPTLEVRGDASSDAEVMVMLAGYPDDFGVWAKLAAHYRSRYGRIVMACLPDFDDVGNAPGPRRPYLGHTIGAIDAALDATIARATPGKEDRVTLVVHDWGCFFGYRFIGRHPDKVSKLIAMDVGSAVGAMPPGTHAAAFGAESTMQPYLTAFYQLFFAFTFVVGKWLSFRAGNAVLGAFIRASLATGLFDASCARPMAKATCWKCAVYYWAWRRGLGGGDMSVPFPTVPTLYLYGAGKNLMLHRKVWETRVRCACDQPTLVP